MTDAELEQALQAVRAANSNHDHHLYMKEAWLLIALRRHAEGLALAQQAQRAWAEQVAQLQARNVGSRYWEPWLAEAAVALGEGNWSRAASCANQVLVDFEEHQEAGRLAEMALQALGLLHPQRVLQFCRDAAQELAQFDLQIYALRQAGIRR